MFLNDQVDGDIHRDKTTQMLMERLDLFLASFTLIDDKRWLKNLINIETCTEVIEMFKEKKKIIEVFLNYVF